MVDSLQPQMLLLAKRSDSKTCTDFDMVRLDSRQSKGHSDGLLAIYFRSRSVEEVNSRILQPAWKGTAAAPPLSLFRGETRRTNQNHH
jgi:hypothetical protein